jgi:Phytanoyl-CoA dioxygenase (PhyH)
MDFRPLPTAQLEVDATDAEAAFFMDNGYLAVARVTTDEELEWLREVYDQLLAMPPTGYLDGIFDLSRPYGTTDTPKLGQLLLPERIVPQIKQTVMWRNAHRIASRLLKTEKSQVESWGHLIFKGANSLAETPWHQDEAYWDVTKDYNALGSWLALDKVDTDNGCLWFVPKSHRGEVLPHMHGGNDPKIHVLQFSEPVDTSAGVPVQLPAGGMTFHHARTHHYSGVNKTNRVRRAWANEFQTTPVLRDTPKSYPWWDQGKQILSEMEKRR